jgi:peroxiredoxin
MNAVMPRKTMVLALIVAAASMSLPVSQAGKYNKVLNIGDPAPAWTDLPGADGRKVSLADFKGKDVVVVVFTCNSCPIAEGYEDRILAFHKKHCGPAGKVALVAINVNLIPDDRLPAMKERAKTKGFAFPYLFDASQKIAKDYGAVYTPEFFVLDKNRSITFMGAMDDRVMEKEVKTNYLEPAVEAALKGEKAKVTETLGRGCMIRYLRERE